MRAQTILFLSVDGVKEKLDCRSYRGRGEGNPKKLVEAASRAFPTLSIILTIRDGCKGVAASISGFGRPARFEKLDYPIDSGDPYDLALRGRPRQRRNGPAHGQQYVASSELLLAVRSTPRKDFAADLPAPGCAPGRQSGDARLGRLPRAPHFPAPVSARDHTPRPPCISGLRRAKSRRGSTPAPEDPALLGPNGPALPGPALLQPRK